jgi:hypothetical protein
VGTWEATNLVERRNEPHGGGRSDAGRRHEPARHRIGLGHRCEFPIRVADFAVEVVDHPELALNVTGEWRVQRERSHTGCERRELTAPRPSSLRT